MEVEKQVCSFELAERLKELGVKQESFFYWIPEDVSRIDWSVESSDNIASESSQSSEALSAFTVAELGETLPREIIRDGLHLHMEELRNASGEWITKYILEYKDGQTCFGISQADARAKMLIYLLENKEKNLMSGNQIG